MDGLVKSENARVPRVHFPDENPPDQAQQGRHFLPRGQLSYASRTDLYIRDTRSALGQRSAAESAAKETLL